MSVNGSALFHRSLFTIFQAIVQPRFPPFPDSSSFTQERCVNKKLGNPSLEREMASSSVSESQEAIHYKGLICDLFERTAGACGAREGHQVPECPFKHTKGKLTCEDGLPNVFKSAPSRQPKLRCGVALAKELEPIFGAEHFQRGTQQT